MNLPNPDQVKDYPSAYAALSTWLWDHPKGGTFSVPLNGQSGPVIAKLSEDLQGAGWDVKHLKDEDTPTIRVTPST